MRCFIDEFGQFLAIVFECKSGVEMRGRGRAGVALNSHQQMCNWAGVTKIACMTF